ncbi:MAG: diacylglycerol kinase family lipid kinase [Candidatus Promineifilaceae bacterium]|nr:diacylglycerol kinase family lipid kinase [Candidatus Promineifilaceae bacterium]
MGAYTIIFNPTSGQGRAAGRRQQMARAFNGLGRVQVCCTTYAGHAAALARAATKRGAEVIVAAGGDGTVNEVVNGIFSANGHGRPNAALAVYPLGCANDFARGLGVRGPTDAGQKAARDRRRTIDMGQVSLDGQRPHYFSFSAGIGLVAAVAQARNRVPLVRGSLLYLLSALTCLKKYRHGQPMRVTFDGRQVETGRFLLLSVNNCPTVGGFPLTPGACLDDGRLDILYVSETSLGRMVYLLLLARQGRHLGHHEFKVRRARQVLIEAERPFPVHLDGQIYPTYWQRPTRLAFRAVQQALVVVA